MTILVFVSPELGVLVITILEGKDMAAMDSNGKLAHRQIKFLTEDRRFVNQLRIICNGDLTL